MKTHAEVARTPGGPGRSRPLAETGQVPRVNDVRVNEVAIFPGEHIWPAPQRSEGNLSSDHICGLGKQGENVTILLDTNQLIVDQKVPA